MLLQDANLPQQAIHAIKERCYGYPLELLRQMKTRLPSNVTRLESLSLLSPSSVLGSHKPSLQNLSFLPLYTGDMGMLERQWDSINGVQWKYKTDTQVVEFWIDVLHHVDAAGECDFNELATFVLSLMALPFSNAAVERAFSQMNLIKTRLRNRMQQKMLEAILRIRGYMSRNRICCDTFTPSRDMLTRHTSKMYDDFSIVEETLPDEF